MKRGCLHLSMLLVVASGCSSVVGGSCRDGYVSCGGTCVDLSSDPRSCGYCGFGCEGREQCIAGECVAAPQAIAGTTMLPGEVTDAPPPPPPPSPPTPGTPGPGVVMPECPLPAIRCADRCADLQTDGAHCGRCDNPCEGFCDAGLCQVGRPGHLVVIGHDFTARNPSTDRLLTNAIFLGGTTPDVLVYEGEADEGAVANARDALSRTAGTLAREWNEARADTDEVSRWLAIVDVFLIHAQVGLTSERAMELVSTWSDAVQSFVEGGGVVIALVGPDPVTSETLLPGLGLLPAGTMQATVNGVTLSVARATDALVVGLPALYRAEMNTVRFDLDLESAVVSDSLAPVVLHETVLP